MFGFFVVVDFLGFILVGLVLWVCWGFIGYFVDGLLPCSMLGKNAGMSFLFRQTDVF